MSTLNVPSVSGLCLFSCGTVPPLYDRVAEESGFEEPLDFSYPVYCVVAKNCCKVMLLIA